MPPDKIDEYLDLMKYEIGIEIDNKITTECYTNSLEDAKLYFNSLIKKYTKPDIDYQVTIFIYDTINAKRIKDYDNTTDIC